MPRQKVYISDEVKEKLRKLVAVHLTDYFPKKKAIRPRFSWQPFTIIRDTTHFTLNDVAEDLGALQTGGKEAIWSNKSIAILIPFDKLYEMNGKNLKIFNPIDTVFTGVIFLPEGTHVVITLNAYESAMHAGVTSQEEMTLQFGETPQKNIPDYYEKEIEGILYKFYNWQKPWKIKEIAWNEMAIMGYQGSHDSGIEDWSTFAKSLGKDVEGKVLHSDHWTSALEGFSTRFESYKRKIIYIAMMIEELEKKGIRVPFSSADNKYDKPRVGLPYYFDAEESYILSADGKKYPGKVIEEITSINVSDKKSVIELLNLSLDRGTDIYSIQYPLSAVRAKIENQDNEYMIKTKKYLKVLRLLAAQYKQCIKDTLSKELIKECPNLQELLKYNYERP